MVANHARLVYNKGARARKRIISFLWRTGIRLAKRLVALDDTYLENCFCNLACQCSIYPEERLMEKSNGMDQTLY